MKFVGNLSSSVLVTVVALLAINVPLSFTFEFKHHDNKELIHVLENVHKACPNITRIYTLSETSVMGVPLYVIEFSTNPGKHEQCKTSYFQFLCINALLFVTAVSTSKPSLISTF